MVCTAPPSLAAVVEPVRHRDRSVKVSLTETDHAQLRDFANAAGIAPARLAHALVLAGLQRLAQDAAEHLLQEAQ